MKTVDKGAAIVLLCGLSILLLGVAAATVNSILYKTNGIKEVVPIDSISKANGESILSFKYFNKITQKSYLIERILEDDERERLVKKTNLEIIYVGYLPGAPRIEGLGTKMPISILILVMFVIGATIRKNIFYLRGKIRLEDFT